MRFRLMEKDAQGNRTGKHLVGGMVGGKFKGRKYKAGDVVESDRPLDTLFRGKFIRLPDAEPPEAEAHEVKGKAKRTSRK